MKQLNAHFNDSMINFDSAKNSNQSSRGTLLCGDEAIYDDNDHFLEDSTSRMLPTISCENMENAQTQLDV